MVEQRFGRHAAKSSPVAGEKANRDWGVCAALGAVAARWSEGSECFYFERA
jgi:hypothetical protein